MSDENEEIDPEFLDDQLLMFITESGFKVVPVQAIIDALAQMESYIKEETGVSQEQLDRILEKVENLVGKEEAMNMEVEEIIGWVNAFKPSL